MTHVQPTFIVPIDSADNKQNIANFFGNQKKAAATSEQAQGIEHEAEQADRDGTIIHEQTDEHRETADIVHSEDNAPLPVPAGTKRPLSPAESIKSPDAKAAKMTPKDPQRSPAKLTPISSKQSKSSTTNRSVMKPLAKAEGSKKITSFFAK